MLPVNSSDPRLNSPVSADKVEQGQIALSRLENPPQPLPELSPAPSAWADLHLPGRQFERIPSPADIKEFLDRYVIGNECAKTALAVVVHNHLARTQFHVGVDDTRRIIEKNFTVARPDEPAYLALLDEMTRLARSYRITRRSGNALQRELGRLLGVALKTEMLKFSANGPSSPNKRFVIRPSRPETEAGRAVKVIIGELLQLRNSQRQSKPLFQRKENLLLIGETGSGKTYMVKKIAEFLRRPFLYVDGSALTEQGWAGLSVSELPGHLLERADHKVSLANRGIIFIDEIDKKASPLLPLSRDISGRGAQTNLLTLLDGYVDYESGVDLSSVLIILAGTFSGITDITRRRLGGGMGFAAARLNSVDEAQVLNQIAPTDLMEFGIIPELAGRMRITYTDPVTPEHLRKILEARESPLRLKAGSLRRSGVELSVTPEAKALIVDRAMALKIGARGLEEIVARLTRDWEFEAPSLDRNRPRRRVIDAEYVKAMLGS